MAVNTAVVKSAADTATQMGDDALNPAVTGTPVNGNRKIIQINLVIDGVEVLPEDIYTALTTIGVDPTAITDIAPFDPVVTVAGEKDTYAHGNWIFNIGPV